MKVWAVWSVIALGAMGCGNKQPASTEPESQETPVMPQSKSMISVTGTLKEGGVSSGKTIAAWNGIPVGERYFYVEPDAGQSLVEGAGARVMVRAMESEKAGGLIGKKVVISGVWQVPERVIVSLDEPRQVPIEIGPGGDTTVVQPEVIFVAHQFELASP